jgi:folate-dependent phosphoribosylglycinamide formyltransferase PurN
MSAPSAQSAPHEGIAPTPRITVLIAGGPLAHTLVNGLLDRFGAVSVLREEPEPKLAILRRRARLVGWLEAVGQAAFGVLQKLISRRSADRLAEIWHQHGLDPHLRPDVAVRDIGSVNSQACRAALRELSPAVVVYGTRIIKGETLRSVTAPFINYHAGINPKYRGQNGAYWARSAGDPAHAGVTVHLVDEGVDTGDVLYQATNQFSSADNIATYQHRQMATALPLMIRAIEDALAGQLRPRHVELPSRQWFHPTLWGYVRTGVMQGVW